MGDTMANSRDVFALGGERQPAGGDPPTPLWRAPTDNNNLSWERLNRDNASAPNVAGLFGCQGGGVQFNLQGGGNIFSFGGGGFPLRTAGKYYTTTGGWQGRRQGNTRGATTHGGVCACNPSTTSMFATTWGTVLRNGSGHQQVGHRGCQDAGARTALAARGRGQQGKTQAVLRHRRALQEFKTYLFVKPGSAYCTFMHSPMNFMAITKGT
jgi:hypothetical protein